MHVPEEMKVKVQEEEQWRELLDTALAEHDPSEQFHGAEQINAVMSRVVRPLLTDIARLESERDEAHMRLRNLEEDHKEAQIYDITNPSGDKEMRTRVAHLLWLIQPTQMPLEWRESGPTLQQICDYVTSALQQKSSENPLPDFDAAEATLNAAMAEQKARLEAEQKIENVRSWLGQVLAEYNFSAGVFGEGSWRYSAGVLADIIRHVLDGDLGPYRPEIEAESDWP